MFRTASVSDRELRIAALQQQARDLFEEFSIPGGAAVVVVGGVANVLTYGHTSRPESPCVTRHTLFSVGSVAKTMVSTALAALVADGLVGWDDPLVGYVPEFGFPDAAARERVSLRDCLANRLGLAREGFCEWGASEELSVAGLLARLAHTPLERPLGSGFSYANPGYAAAALVVARLSDMPFIDFVRERLLAPAAINGVAAGSEARGLRGRSECHVLHEDSDGTRPTRVDPYFADHAVGATGVWMTPAAIEGWLGLHLGRGVVGSEVIVPRSVYGEICRSHITVPEADRPFGVGPSECSEVGYGLGWFCTRYRGHRVLHHSGAEVGANAHLSMAPDVGVGVGVVANATSPAADAIGLTLLDAALDLPSLPWARRARASHPQASSRSSGLNLRHGTHPGTQLNDYAGRYDHAGNGPAHVTVRGTLLEVCFPDAPRFDGHLHPLGGSWFAPKPKDVGVRSVLSEPAEIIVEHGRATRLCLPGLGTWERA